LSNLEEEETSDDGQKETEDGSKVWAAEDETNLNTGQGTGGGCDFLVVHKAKKTARLDSERNVSGVDIIGKEVSSVLECHKGVDVPDFVGAGGEVFVGNRISVENSEVRSVWVGTSEGWGVGEGTSDEGKAGGVWSDVIVDGSLREVGVGAEITEPFLVSGEGWARVSSAVASNGLWVNEGSLAEINLGILKVTVFNPASEGLAAAKRFSPNNGQRERGIESAGHGPFIGSNSATKLEVGDVQCLISGSVEDVESLAEQDRTSQSRLEGGISVATDGESWEDGTASEWGLVNSDCRNSGVVFVSEGEGVVIVVEDDHCGWDCGVEGGGRKSEGLGIQLSVPEGPGVGRGVLGIDGNISRDEEDIARSDTGQIEVGHVCEGSFIVLNNNLGLFSPVGLWCVGGDSAAQSKS